MSLLDPRHAMGKPRDKDLRTAAQEAIDGFPWYVPLEEAGFPEVLPLLLDAIDAAHDFLNVSDDQRSHYAVALREKLALLPVPKP